MLLDLTSAAAKMSGGNIWDLGLSVLARGVQLHDGFPGQLTQHGPQPQLRLNPQRGCVSICAGPGCTQ